MRDEGFVIRLTPYLILLALSLGTRPAFGAWADQSAGLPPVEIITAKTIGAEAALQTMTQDRFGRLFVGANRLLVYDGQSWQSFPKLNTEPLHSLAASPEGRIWAGGVNELGYFDEPAPGLFAYHSLTNHLPKEAREPGILVGCAPVGQATYFVAQDRVLIWNGTEFKIIPFESRFRLHLFKTDDDWWFFHFETGLYRLTERTLELEFPSSDLENIAVVGLFRDKTGLVTLSNAGFIRPGTAGTVLSQQKLNSYLTKHLVSSFGELTDGNLVIGTVSGGIVLASRTGELIRIWNTKSGLPRRGIHSLAIAPTGEVLGITEGEFFHFSASGHSTLFNNHNGLQGRMVKHLQPWNAELYTITDEGAFRLTTPPNTLAAFQSVASLNEPYSFSIPFGDRLLLSRAGAVDSFDGTETQTVHRHTGGPFSILPSKQNPLLLYAANEAGLTQLEFDSDGIFKRKSFLRAPGRITSMFEDSASILWLGTAAHGAFQLDPATGILSPVIHPTTKKPLSSSVKVLGNQRLTLLLATEGVFRADPEKRELRLLDGIPSFEAIDAAYLPGREEILILYKREGSVGSTAQGAGLLSFDQRDKPQWRPIEIASRTAIGKLNTAVFTTEKSRLVLWLGGSEGILRLDYNRIKALQPPPAPTIVLKRDPLDFSHEPNPRIFPFSARSIRLMVATGDSVLSKDTLIQTRLGPSSGEWSPPSTRRIFEFSDLSEGTYFFEARTVNSAGMTSHSPRIHFVILPPWYRTNLAYAGFFGGLVLAGFAFIQVRDRRILRRSEQLKALVDIRTEELVRAGEAKDEFLASISHEILNPMNGIIGIAETIQTATLDQASRHQLKRLHQCAKHLSSLLEDILDFSRAQAGTVKVDAHPFDLSELMESVAALTAADSVKSGIPVEIAVSPGVPSRLLGDPRRIRQILLNYVGNALKYSNRGQVDVTVWRNQALGKRVEIFFAVSDEGPGISPDEQTKLFTRFERGTYPQLARIPGTGLGLAHCKALAEKMGGAVWLKSEVGKGSSFYFSATLGLAEHVAEPKPAPRQNSAAKPKRALVVDDEEYNRVALTGFLEEIGLVVDTAGGFAHALALAGTHDFDLIFLDFSLPGLSGPDIARAIRRLPSRSAKATLVATTASNTPTKRAACLAAGMDVFLDKPITLNRLYHVLGLDSSALENPSLGTSQPRPANPLANLRLLATKKNVSFATEVALYLAELETELNEIKRALNQEDPVRLTFYCHLLQGRCSFIGEQDLPQLFKKIDRAGIKSSWEEARSLFADAQIRANQLRVSLSCEVSTAQPG